MITAIHEAVAASPASVVSTLPDHNSPTAAKSCLACSRRFYFERVACIRKKTSVALHLGKAVHAVHAALQGSPPPRLGMRSLYQMSKPTVSTTA